MLLAILWFRKGISPVTLNIPNLICYFNQETNVHCNYHKLWYHKNAMPNVCDLVNGSTTLRKAYSLKSMTMLTLKHRKWRSSFRGYKKSDIAMKVTVSIVPNMPVGTSILKRSLHEAVSCWDSDDKSLAVWD